MGLRKRSAQASAMRKAGLARPARDERIANLENRDPASPGDAKVRQFWLKSAAWKTLQDAKGYCAIHGGELCNPRLR